MTRRKIKDEWEFFGAQALAAGNITKELVDPGTVNTQVIHIYTGYTSTVNTQVIHIYTGYTGTVNTQVKLN